jgi:hypothetical protein
MQLLQKVLFCFVEGQQCEDFYFTFRLAAILTGPLELRIYNFVLHTLHIPISYIRNTVYKPTIATASVV